MGLLDEPSTAFTVAQDLRSAAAVAALLPADTSCFPSLSGDLLSIHIRSWRDPREEVDRQFAAALAVLEQHSPFEEVPETTTFLREFRVVASTERIFGLFVRLVVKRDDPLVD